MLAAPAYAEKRVALVVGNDAYQNVPKLQKAVTDARTMASTLRNSASRSWSRRTRPARCSQALLAFDNAVEPGDTAFFFFAGHGFEIAGQNYLLPTDVPAATEGQEELVRDASFAPTASSTGSRRRRARRSWCSTPAATIRSSGRDPRRRRRRRAGADDPRRKACSCCFRPAPSKPRSIVSPRRRRSEFGVHPHLRQGADAARRQPGADREAHAPAGQRGRGQRPAQADAGLLRRDRRRRRPERQPRRGSEPASLRSRPSRRAAAEVAARRGAARTDAEATGQCADRRVHAPQWRLVGDVLVRRPGDSGSPGGSARPAPSRKPASSTRSTRAPDAPAQSLDRTRRRHAGAIIQVREVDASGERRARFRSPSTPRWRCCATSARSST